MASDMPAPVNLGLPDPELVRRTLSSPPFHAVEGVINFRDFGVLSDSDSSNNEKGGNAPRIRPGVLFRSGELVRLTDKGKTALRDLGVTTVFDLRSESEIRKYQSATPDIPGVRFVHVPVTDSDEYDPMALATKVAKFAADEKNAFSSLYSGILENGGPAYEKILIHLRDKPGEPCLVHCTAGKDRTGVFAAILLLLLGASDAAIAHDYSLTTYGLAPVLPTLIARFQKEAIYRDNWKGFQNMGSAKYETILATLTLLRSTYGSAEGYIKTCTSLTDADITRIKRNLLLSSVPESETSASSKFQKEKEVMEWSPISAYAIAPLSSLVGWVEYLYASLGWVWRTVL